MFGLELPSDNIMMTSGTRTEKSYYYTSSVSHRIHVHVSIKSGGNASVVHDVWSTLFFCMSFKTNGQRSAMVPGETLDYTVCIRVHVNLSNIELNTCNS